MKKIGIVKAAEHVQAAFQLSKAGIPEGQYPRAGFDAASIHLKTAAERIGPDRRMLVESALDSLLRAYETINADSSINARASVRFHMQQQCKLAIRALIFE